MEATHKACWQLCEDLIKSWDCAAAGYVHHIQLLRDNSAGGVDFNIIYSKPSKRQPIPSQVANVGVSVESLGDEETGAAPILTYCVEGTLQQRTTDIPMLSSWLDRVVERKKVMGMMTADFEATGVLPTGRAFVPGEYKVAETLELCAEEVCISATELAADAHMEQIEALEAAQMYGLETPDELEQTLHMIFDEADVNRDGSLQLRELQQVLETAELRLTSCEVRALITSADKNGDGQLDYSEFVPMAIEVIQNLRLREMQHKMDGADESSAEMLAAYTLHGLSREALTEELVSGFRLFDTNGDGTLSLDEFEKCVRQLKLGPTKLTDREMRSLMATVDDNADGVIQYSEFAPLMFDVLLDAIKVGFLSHEMSELEAYLLQLLQAFDQQGTGLIVHDAVAKALNRADLIQPRMSLVQIVSLAAHADNFANAHGLIDYELFVSSAAQLITLMSDPTNAQERAHAKKRVVLLVEKQRQEALEQSLRAVFKRHDVNQDGTMSLPEFRTALMETNLGMTTKQIRLLCVLADANHDGSVDVDEFVGVAYTALAHLAKEEAVDAILVRGATSGGTAGNLAEVSVSAVQSVVMLHAVFDSLSESSENRTVGGKAFADTVRSQLADLLVDESIRVMVETLHIAENHHKPYTWAELMEVHDAAVAELTTE